MKVKYQSGGVVSYTPFIPQSGTTQTTSTSSSGTQEKITGTIQKEIIDVLKESGIQSDVDTFLSQANTFLTNSQHLSAMSLFGGEDDSYTMSHLIGVLSMANRVKQNKLQWDEASEKLNNENAWNEVAVASNGHIYVYGEDGLSTISTSEFYKNRDKYQALTNSQVLGLREREENLAFNSNILLDLSGTIGMKTISDQLTDIVNKFGSISRNEYIKNTGDQISQSAYDGMQILIGNGPQGYYKATTKSERENIQSALSYLWRAIGSDGQKRLRAETAINGGDPNKNQYDLLLEVLQHHTDFEQSVDFDSAASNYDPDGNSKGSTTNSSKYVEQTRAERYASGNGFGNPQWFPILSSDKSTPMYVFAQNLGPVLSKDEKTLFGDANLEEVLNEAYGIGGITDRSSITFGEIPITWDDASKLMFESGTNMHRVLMPVKKDATGKIRPNFELQEKINEMNESDLFKNMSSESIRNSVADIPGIKYNEQTGLIEAVDVAPFLVLQATASTDTLSKDLKNTKYLHNLSKDEDRKKKNKYNTIIGSRPQYGGGEKRQDTGNPKTTWWMGYQFYTGNVFIPINDSIMAASIYNNQLVPQDTYINMSAKEQARQEFQQRQVATDYLVQNGDLRLNF